MKIAVFLGLVASAPSWALCLNPFGCEPKNYEECVQEASKRPTERGVTVAKQACDAKWRSAESGADWSDRKAAEQRREAIEFSEKWFATVEAWSLEKGPNRVKEWVAALGDPFLVLGPRPCSKLGSTALPGHACYAYFWADNRPGRTHTHASFQLEAADSKDGAVWAVWRDSR